MKSYLALKTSMLAIRITQRSVVREFATPSAQNETFRPNRTLKERIRDRAILIGQTRPAPLILIDAVRGKGAA